MWGEAIPNQSFSIGIHPKFIPENVDWPYFMEVANNPLCLAIGECGLDTFAAKFINEQINIFSKQIEIANKIHKPIIIHCVKAFQQLAALHCKASTPWILHGFVNNTAIANNLLKKEICFSFGKAIFSAKGNAQKVLQQLPITNVFLETDAAENISIEEIYEQAARLLNYNVQDLQAQILQNFQRIFAIEYL